MFSTNSQKNIKAIVLCVFICPMAANARPICESSDSDSDGDGFGWENHETCLVAASVTPLASEPGDGTSNGMPKCLSGSSDSDGDGYGWENNNSCLVVAIAADAPNTRPGKPACNSATSDPDGDGYGWENQASCVVAIGSGPVTAGLNPEDSVLVRPATGAAAITDVVLITGQSNALGSMTTYDPVLDQPVDRVYAYTDNGWEQASLHQVWDLGYHPAMGLGDDPHNNFGFHFGKTIAAQRRDRVVGIILVTAPGEGISHWDAESGFYNKIRNKALSAINALPHKSGVDGILWHQGETDWSQSGSNDSDLENFPENDYYSHKLWSLITNFRMESWFDTDRPFICGETAGSPINTRLNALNRDSDNWTACVPGEGLPTYDEVQVHFNAEGLRELGANYADVYLQMIN